MLLILLIVGLVCFFINTYLFLAMVLMSAAAVYYDGVAINAGKSAQKQDWGKLETWNPVSWGVLTFLIWILFLPLYLYKRESIFRQNN